MRNGIAFKTTDGTTLRGWHYLPDGTGKHPDDPVQQLLAEPMLPLLRRIRHLRQGHPRYGHLDTGRQSTSKPRHCGRPAH
jgi:hypothetical protein